MFSISFVLRILVSSEASAFSVSLSEEGKNDEYHTGLSCQGQEVLKPAATDYHQSVLSIGANCHHLVHCHWVLQEQGQRKSPSHGECPGAGRRRRDDCSFSYATLLL